jgi:drug/metabolite transporter (DMT)-like permease
MLATGSSVFWAFYFILNVRDKRDEGIKLLLNFLFGSLYLILTVFISGEWPGSISFRGAAASVYIGMFEMGITFFFWLRALQLAKTTANVSNLVYLAPFLSLFLVHYILHEPVYYTTPVGLILIISGIFVQNSRSKTIL